MGKRDDTPINTDFDQTAKNGRNHSKVFEINQWYKVVAMSDVSYPKSMVTTFYALFGGAVGGLLVFLSFSINDGRLIIQSSDGEINFLFLFLCVGMVLGFIPLLIAGLCISYWQVVIKELIDYLKVFAFGVIATIIPLILYWIVNNVLSILQQWYITKRVENGVYNKRKPKK